MFSHADGDVPDFDRLCAGTSGKAALVVWRRRDNVSVCVILYDHLSVRHVFCIDDNGHEPVYHLPGLCESRYESGCDRCSGEYHPRSGIYFRTEPGCARCGTGYGTVADVLLRLCPALPVWEKGTDPHYLSRV